MAESLGDALLRTTMTLQGLADQMPASLEGVTYFTVVVRQIDLGTVLAALVGALGLWSATPGLGSINEVDFIPRQLLEFNR